MKCSSKIALIAALALALTALAAAQQTSTPNTQQQDQSMQGMEGMHGQMHQGQQGQMHGMMQDCHKNMQAMQQSNARTKQDIKSAKQSNDPAKMRAALDEADQALSAMNQHMNTCMGMMQNMGGMMGGQEQTPQTQKPPQQ